MVMGDDEGRGALDPGLKEQFERDRIVVRTHPSETPDADAVSLALRLRHGEPLTEAQVQRVVR